MWEQLNLPGIEGAVRGFTFPRHDALLVLTPDGLVRMALDPVEIRLVADATALASLYDPRSKCVIWEGEWQQVYSDDGGDVPLLDHSSGDRIVPDHDGTLLITDPAEREVRQRIASIRLPPAGSWLYAGFSHDQKWLVAGEPRGMQVFRRVHDAG